MTTIYKRPESRHWSRRSLSFTPDEVMDLEAGRVSKIIVLTPSMRVFCTITEFGNILETLTCKGDYYVGRYKKDDTDY